MATQNKISLFLFSLLLTTTSTLITPSHAAELGHPNDKNALLQIKAQLGPNSQYFSSWQPNTDCCNWINIACDNQTNRVTILGQTNELSVKFLQLQLLLYKNQLTGSILESFGSFKNLVLQAYENQLSGPIPKSLSKAGFSWLYISNNQFSGDASFLFRNNKLVLIYLRNNAFSFDFSKVVFNYGLRGLDVSHNMIYGSLPKQISQLPLEVFNVSYNQLCGPIPTGKWLNLFWG